MREILRKILHWAILLGSGLALILLWPVALILKLWERVKFRRQMPGKLFGPRIVIAAGILLIFVLWFLSYFRFLPSPGASEEIIPLVINQGESFKQIASRLNDVDLIKSTLLFRGTAKIMGLDRKIYAGRYDFKNGLSMFAILKQLSKGGATAINVTIPPGLTVRQIAKIFRETIGADSSRFLLLTEDRLFIQSLDLPVKNLEGFLFPETYNFYWKTKEEEIIQNMAAQFKRVLFNELDYRPSGILKDEVKNLVILASLIQKEGFKPEEFPLISAVFHNRLRIDMPLQCDPTILYVLPPLNRPILPEDLQLKSPYNTYKHYGLPPGPICNPGKEALEAAMHPASAKYLYFVHRGDGTHIFSHTLEEHNRAIWQLKKNKNG
jgi:UPF0755 protein